MKQYASIERGNVHWNMAHSISSLIQTIPLAEQVPALPPLSHPSHIDRTGTYALFNYSSTTRATELKKIHRHHSRHHHYYIIWSPHVHLPSLHSNTNINPTTLYDATSQTISCSDKQPFNNPPPQYAGSTSLSTSNGPRCDATHPQRDHHYDLP